MKNLRALQSGIIVWVLIFLTFTLMSFLPIIKDSTDVQNVIVLLMIIPFVMIASTFYYKKGTETNGIYLGLIIVITCLILDAIITLPLVIIPKGGTYASFFIEPGLAVMGAEIFIVSFLYSRLKTQTN